jgi:DNA-binding NarL/FixJ family response regulator
MDVRKVFLLGNSLLTEGMAHILEGDPQIEILGSASTVEEAQEALANQRVDAIIVMGTDDQTTIRVCPILAQHSDVPILRADISQNQIQLITSQNIEAKPSKLLELITNIPVRR